jgi:hypothetical protein
MESTPLEMTSTPPAAPAPATAPTPAPATPQVQSMPIAESRGEGFMETLKSLNPLEILFGILGATTLYYTIYYYRHSITISKSSKMEMENKIDDLEIKVSDLSSALQSQKQQQQSNNSNFGF